MSTDKHIYVIITSTTKLKLRDKKLALGYMFSLVLWC